MRLFLRVYPLDGRHRQDGSTLSSSGVGPACWGWWSQVAADSAERSSQTTCHSSAAQTTTVLYCIGSGGGGIGGRDYDEDEADHDDDGGGSGGRDQILMRSASLSEAQRRRIDFPNLSTSGLNRAYDHTFILPNVHTMAHSYFLLLFSLSNMNKLLEKSRYRH